MIYFTAHTFKCVCHCRRAMFRVLGMYNFAFCLKIIAILIICSGFTSIILLLSLRQITWFNTQQLRSWLDGDHLITHLYTHIAIVHPFCNPQILLMTRFDRTRRVPTQLDATLCCSSNSDMSCNYCTSK